MTCWAPASRQMSMKRGFVFSNIQKTDGRTDRQTDMLLNVTCWSISIRMCLSEPIGLRGGACVCVSTHGRPWTSDKHAVLCASELVHIFWSGAFISTLLNVRAGKVEVLWCSRSPLISYMSPCCYERSQFPAPQTDFCCAKNIELNHFHFPLKCMSLTPGLIITVRRRPWLFT